VSVPDEPRLLRWRAPAAWLTGALLLLALVLAVAHLGEGRRFAELLREARPAWLGVAALLQAGTYVCAAGVWQRALRASGVRLAVGGLVPLGLAKLFADQALPSVGLSGTLLVVRALLRRGVSRGIAVAAMLAGLMSYYVAYAIAVAVSLAVLWRHGEFHRALVALAFFFSLPAAGVPLAILWLRGRASKSLPRALLRLPGARELMDALARAPRGALFGPRVACETSVLQLAVFLLDAATLEATLLAVGSPVAPGVAFASFIVASMVASLAWVPGGLGTFEGTCVAMLHVHGVGLEVSLAAVLLLRGFSFWLPMLPGLWIARREMLHESAGPPA
jgi:hypothetical protein